MPLNPIPEVLSTAITGLTSGRIVVASGASSIGNANFTASGNVLDLAAAGTLSIGTVNPTVINMGHGGGTGGVSLAWLGQYISIPDSNSYIYNLGLYYSAAQTATVGAPLQVTPGHAFRGSYWNGSTAIVYDANLYLGMDSTTPTAHFGMSFPTVGEKFQFTSSGSVWARGGSYLVDSGNGLDTSGAGTLNIGTVNATSMNIGTGNVANINIGNASTGTNLNVSGGSVAITQNPLASLGNIPALKIVPGALTNGTASTESNGFLYSARTHQWATGALTTQREVLIQAPTYSFVAASTITTAATLAISGAPVAGTNATITNPYAFWVQSGWALFGGNVYGSSFDSPAGNSLFLGATNATSFIIGNTANTTSMALRAQTFQFAQSANTAYGQGLLYTGGSQAGFPTTLEYNDAYFNLARTVTWNAGAVANQRFVLVSAPTIASTGGASTFTNAATMAITGAPVAGTNATLTNAYALWTQSGRVQHDAGTTDNTLVVKGNASNISALAAFKDSNGNLHFGIDSQGLPTLGSYHHLQETFGGAPSTAVTSGLIGSTGFAIQVSGGAGAHYTSTVTNDTTSAIGAGLFIDPSITANNYSVVYNNYYPSLSNNTSTVAVFEWSAMFTTQTTNANAHMSIANSAQMAHPNGFGFWWAGSGNWQWYTDNGTTRTITACTVGVAPTANRFQRFRIEFYGSATPVGVANTNQNVVKLYIDGTLVQTIVGANVVTPAASGFEAGVQAIATAATPFLVIAEYNEWWTLVNTPFAP